MAIGEKSSRLRSKRGRIVDALRTLWYGTSWIDQDFERLQKNYDEAQGELVRLSAELKKASTSEDALSHRVDRWMKQEAEVWIRCWNAAEEFDFKAAEERFRKQGLSLLGELFEELIHREPLRLPKGARCPHCGIGTLSQNGYRPKFLETTLKSITLRRAYYVCDQSGCSQGIYPLDLKLGLGRDRASPELHQIQMEVSQAMSFGSAAKLLNQLLGGTISSRQLSRKTLQEGAAMAADQQAREPESTTTGELATYGSIDGGAAPMKPSQVVKRHGRSSDGKARSREAK